MPVAVKRTSVHTENILKSTTTKVDINGTEFNLPVYNVFVFRKEVPCILYYLANGFDWAMSYLGVSNIIDFLDEIDETDDEKYLYFQVSSKCYIRVYKSLFLKYPYVQSIVGGILHVSTNRVTIDDLYNKEYWIKKLSNNNSVEKGNDNLIFVGRLMDETTKKILKVCDHDKTDIYAILRWMMMNFNELRLRDNLSLDNKRLRCNEYIAALLTLEFSGRLHRVITLGNKATMQNYLDIFKFSGEKLAT